MIQAKEHPHEKERFNDLKSYSILDTLPEADYDNLTAIAAKICDTPISLVTLIDDKRQWFKSHHGLDITETPKELAFCAHTIIDEKNILIVPDTRKDERFKNNPFVTGNPFILFYAGIPLISENGYPLGTLCVLDQKPKVLTKEQLHDLNALSKQVMNLLTLRKKAMELEKFVHTLERKQQELEETTYLASHDLKEPLNSIMSFIELLEANAAEKNLSEIEKKCFQYINESSLRMKALIDGIINYSRIGNTPHSVKVNCNVLIKSVINDLDSLVKKSNAKIHIEELPEIYAFKTEIRLLFQNLICNAIKFTKSNIDPIISISCQKKERHWEFVVKDNGIGILPENTKKIFSLFQRLHNASEYNGAGLGLAHCKKIVTLHKGKIWVNSQIGIGSAFHFTIHENIKTPS